MKEEGMNIPRQETRLHILSDLSPPPHTFTQVYLADPNGGWSPREPGHTSLESCNIREWSTATRVDGTDTELVGLPWL